MKKTIFALICACVLIGGTAAAQPMKTSSFEKEAQTKRGPYLTNRLFDNIFIGVGGGINIYSGENDDYGSFGKRLSPALDVSLGKWVTPSVGLRLQYAGLNAKGWTNLPSAFAKGTPDNNGMYEEKFNVMNLHFDVMWNISNAIGGYRADRTWNFVPYIGFGWGRAVANDNKNNELVANIGLLNNIRLCDALDLTLEVRDMIVNQNFDGVVDDSRYEGMMSVTAGLSFKFNRRDFSRAPQVTAPDYTPYNNKIRTLENELAAKDRQINELNNKLAAAMKKKPEVVAQVQATSPMAIFFEIGKADLTEKEIINIGYIAETIKESPNKTFKLIGSADKQTGSAKRNQQLSEMRAQAVYDVLVNKFGVNKNQLQIIAKGSQIEPFDQPALNRVTIIE